jgi:hypothetical protein
MSHQQGMLREWVMEGEFAIFTFAVQIGVEWFLICANFLCFPSASIQRASSIGMRYITVGERDGQKKTDLIPGPQFGKRQRSCGVQGFDI